MLKERVWGPELLPVLWLQAQAPLALLHYSMVSAEDCPERDPASWVLECIPDPPTGSASGAATTSTAAAPPGAEHWVAVDERAGERFAARNQLRSFPAAAHVAARRWRLRVTRTAEPGAANSVQLACLNLYGAPPGSHPPGPGASSQVRPLLPAALEALSTAAEGSAGSEAGVAGASGRAGALSAGDRALLLRILSNMHRHPGDPQFLGIRAAKLGGLLQPGAALLALLAAGFQPLLVPAAMAGQGGGGGGVAALGVQRLELVVRAEGSAGDVGAAGQLVRVLEAGSGQEAATGPTASGVL